MAYGCGYVDGYIGDCGIDPDPGPDPGPTVCGGIGYGGMPQPYGGFGSCSDDYGSSIGPDAPRSNVRNICIVRCN